MKTKFKTVSVRYNTNSDGVNNCWRLICDNTEYLTNKVEIQGTVNTSKDWMPELSAWKHHVTIENALVEYSVDYSLIKCTEKRLFKDILKTVTYRILGTSVTFGIGFFSTGRVDVAVTLGFSDLILKPLVYFLHERIWGLYKK